jgi:hypothetical protein
MKMQIPGLNLLTGASASITAEKSSSALAAEIERRNTSKLQNTENAADKHNTSSNGETVLGPSENVKEEIHKTSGQKVEDESTFEIVDHPIVDPLDIAIAASSHHSSAESESDEEDDSDDVDRF